MANIDFSAWNASKAWAAGAKSDDPAAFYNGICAGKKAGDPKTQEAHALPYRYTPSSPPNAAGVRNALARLSQTKGLTNASEAKTKLEGLMAKIQAAEKNRSAPDLNTREYRSIHADEAPGGMLRCIPFPGQMRGKFRKMGGRNVYEVEGYATVYNRGYEMWDKAGTYTEVMAGRAFDLSLAQQPDVAFLVNHKGVTMARTRSGSGKNPSLLLSSDSTGMGIHAFLNADRQDVKDLALAIDDEDVTEMSLAFMIDDYTWNDDFTELTINRADINRGDVSAVNYGANPFTTIQSRSAAILRDIVEVPEVVAREAITRLQLRLDALKPIDDEPDSDDFVESATAEHFEQKNSNPEEDKEVMPRMSVDSLRRRLDAHKNDYSTRLQAIRSK